jgi:hypothetical protein
MKEELKKTLIERGYPEKAAIEVADKLMKIDSTLQPHLKSWIESNETHNIAAGGFTVDELMKQRPGMTYPAALLTIDWLLREPEIASRIIKKGVR